MGAAGHGGGGVVENSKEGDEEDEEGRGEERANKPTESEETSCLLTFTLQQMVERLCPRQHIHNRSPAGETVGRWP